MTQPLTTNLQSMTEIETWSRLRSQSFGRLAVTADNQPEIFPVNFLADDRTILIRTAEGKKLDMLAANPLVAFEVDQVALGLIWSVVVKGIARRIASDEEIEDARRRPLWSWPIRMTDEFIRIEPIEVSGRRFAR